MYRIVNLDNRRHAITTGSARLAGQAYSAIKEAGGTPHATRRGEGGVTVAWTPMSSPTESTAG